MIRGEKLPYEEYVLDIRKLVQLSKEEQKTVAAVMEQKADALRKEKNISHEAARQMLLKEYRRVREENMLPKRYLVDTDPEFFEKMLLLAAQGVRGIPVLTEAEYDRRKGFTLDYMKNAEVI